LLKPGSRVGYDGTWFAKKKVFGTVIPVGYWHGFPRSLSNRGEVLAGGMPCLVLGRVSMDMIVIGSSKPLQPYSEVIFIGGRGKKQISAETVAEKAGTINYELVTRLNPLMRREII